MILELLVAGLIVVVALVHYRAGIWGAVLTVWGVLLAGAVAFGFYLPLARAVFGMTDPEATSYFWGDALALLALFFVAFGALRLFMSQLLRNTMSFGVLIDTIGGTAIGAVSGYLCGGVLVVLAQMMPMSPGSVLGYKPFELTSGQRTGHMILRGDDAVLGLYNFVIGGALNNKDAKLAAFYPADREKLAEAVAEAGALRGSTRDDILRFYFLRRLEYATRSAKGMGPLERRAGRTIPLAAGANGLSKADRAPGLTLTMQRVWMSPTVAWQKPDGGLVQYGPKDLEWFLASDGSMLDKEKMDADSALLFVELTFKPDKNEPLTATLDEWRLESSLKGSDGKALPLTRPLLCGPAKSEGKGAAPIDSVAERDVPGLLEVPGGDMIKCDPAGDLAKGADRLFIAKNATGSFPDNKRSATATLVYLVPALTQPWEYGLRYLSKASPAAQVVTSGGSQEGGLFARARQKLEPFDLTVLENGKRMSAMPEAEKKASPGNELVEVKLKVKSAKPALLTARIFKLVNTAENKEYAALLLEEPGGAVEKAKPFGKTVPYDVLLGPLGQAAPEPSTKPRLWPDWQLYLAEKTAEADVHFVFELPQGKPFGQFRFALSESVSEEAPDWFMRRHPRPLSSSTHEIQVARAEPRATIPMIMTSGAVSERGPAKDSGQEILVIALTIKPKKAEDMSYYNFPLADIDLKLAREGKEIQLHSWRFTGEAGFHLARGEEAMKQPQTVQNERILELAYYVSKPRGDSRLTFRAASFSKDIPAAQ